MTTILNNWLSSLSTVEWITLVVLITCLTFWLCYQFARLVGMAQSGDIDWKEYEPWPGAGNARFNAEEELKNKK